jgi:DNA mismatch repair protein MutS2
VDWLIPAGATCVVVSGPNTGGKTASMKTLALACLLARAGGHPPAAPSASASEGGVRVPWARRVLADLGDSQSLSEGLSTFSGHVARLGRILAALEAPCAARDAGCDGVALVLLDEPGGGTDPAEGAALACALLEKLAAPACGALTVATSHYEEAKRLGMAAAAGAAGADDGASAAPRRFANAAVEFDAAALAPTYRLLWGVTGESYALEVAAALGLPAPLLAAATAAMADAGGARGREARAGALAARLDAQLGEAEAGAAGAAAARAAAEAEAAALRARAAALLPGEASLAAAAEADAAAALAAARAAFGAVASSPDPSGALAAALAAHTPPGWQVSPSSGVARRVGAPDAPAWAPRVGSRVRVRRLGTRPATVLALHAASAEVEVRLGLLLTRVPIDEVEPATDDDADAATSASSPAARMPSPRVSRASARASASAAAAPAAGSAADASALVAIARADNTLDLRGMYVHDALAALEGALVARGRRSGASALFVVHGVGTGRVKAAVAEALRAHPLVLRAEAAPQRDGGAGCTVAYLR